MILVKHWKIQSELFFILKKVFGNKYFILQKLFYSGVKISMGVGIINTQNFQWGLGGRGVPYPFPSNVPVSENKPAMVEAVE